ncbi:MAG: hypothetical protein HGA87_00070 [Desulfobulbaceae bacterium]|nr:hypothetical protein [Desulfobulbaceae bacterium]
MKQPHSIEPTFVIPGNLISSKNSRNVVPVKKKDGTTKRVPMKSKAAKNDETALMSLFLEHKAFRVAWLEKIAQTGFPVRLRIKIYRQTRARCDAGNITQNLFDCMVKSGLLPDDSMDYILPYYEPYEVDSKNPRTEINIVEVAEYFGIRSKEAK